MSAERYEDLAAAWDRSGRAAPLLPGGYDLIALRGWAWSPGGKADGASEVLQEFIRAAVAAQPDDWLDAYLSERESCLVCGETWQLENVRLCTHCLRACCYACAARQPRARNGNEGCSCGGELVG